MDPTTPVHVEEKQEPCPTYEYAVSSAAEYDRDCASAPPQNQAIIVYQSKDAAIDHNQPPTCNQLIGSPVLTVKRPQTSEDSSEGCDGCFCFFLQL